MFLLTFRSEEPHVTILSTLLGTLYRPDIMVYTLLHYLYYGFGVLHSICFGVSPYFVLFTSFGSIPMLIKTFTTSSHQFVYGFLHVWPYSHHFHTLNWLPSRNMIHNIAHYVHLQPQHVTCATQLIAQPPRCKLSFVWLFQDSVLETYTDKTSFGQRLLSSWEAGDMNGAVGFDGLDSLVRELGLNSTLFSKDSMYLRSRWIG